MKKILTLIIYPIFLMFFSIAVLAQVNPTKLQVHYYRYDESYNNFHVHIWEKEPFDSPGVDIKFDKTDDWGSYLEIDLTETLIGATKIGVIIKDNAGWEPDVTYREPGGDRFFNLRDVEVKNGVAHVYFVEGDLNIGLSDSDLNSGKPNKGDRVRSASFISTSDIKVSLTNIGESYEILSNNIVINTGEITAKNFNVTIGEIDLRNSYEIKVKFNDNLTYTSPISIEQLYDTDTFIDNYTYNGTLGVIINSDETIFRIWAPTSQGVTLNLYKQGHPNFDNLGNKSDELLPFETHELNAIENGAWEISLPKNLHNTYYTFTVDQGSLKNEVVDPYAYSTGANGLRGLIVDFEKINPNNWIYNKRPQTIKNLTDYIVYELHVRDLTSHESWNGNEDYRGKFMGLTQSGTTYTNNLGTTVTTGLDHLVELGINAVQFLPIFDFGYVDETRANDPSYTEIFNWGYMPSNFNTLEGSYSTNPFDGLSRIKEFKNAVLSLHNNNIRVIMDVVYNHTGESESSNFNKILPGYYHRLTENGGFSNGSGTGNETSSERPMMRKFIVDSIEFWTKEYNLSGFRFDLMGLHDIETMNAIRELVDEIDETIVLYGEPWTGGTSTLDSNLAADKGNVINMNNIGAFNDTFRDSVKGRIDTQEHGFIQGNFSNSVINNVKYGIVGGINHSGLNNSTEIWHSNPNKTINYVSAHDNLTLRDQLAYSGITNDRTLQRMQQQANSIVLTSQGISFIHAGADFMRSKPKDETSDENEILGGFDKNTYNRSDQVNQLRWDKKAEFANVFNYYKGMIAINKTYPHFRMTNSDDIRNNLQFIEVGNGGIGYKITKDDIIVVVIHMSNTNNGSTDIYLNDDIEYTILSNAIETDITGLSTVTNRVRVPDNTSMILVSKVLEMPTYPDFNDSSSNSLIIITLIGVGILIVLGTSFILIRKKRSKLTN